MREANGLESLVAAMPGLVPGLPRRQAKATVVNWKRRV
jgi:hypothetical protein